MQGMPGALQVLAALLHGVPTIYTYDSNEEPTVFGPSSHSGCASYDILPTGTSAPSNVARPSAGLPRRTPSRQGETLTVRLVLATITHLTKAEITSLVEGPYLPGRTILHDLVYGHAAARA